jgi:hypothetical protein
MRLHLQQFGWLVCGGTSHRENVLLGRRGNDLWTIALGWQSMAGLMHTEWRHLTLRWRGRVIDKVPSPDVGARAAQLNR